MPDNFTFDEEKAIEFIRASLQEDISRKYSDDDILYIIDIIWDYYDKKGLLSLDNIDSDDELLDIDELIVYVKKELAKDKNVAFDIEDIKHIVKGEIDYEESLEDPF